MRTLGIATGVLFVTTILFAMMAFAPRTAPIKTGATRTAAEADVETDVEQVATRFTESLITFNHRTIDEDAERMTRETTRNFAEQYQVALRGDLNVFKRRVGSAGAISTGDVKGATLLSRDDGTATVLVVATQTVRTRREPDPRTQFSLVELTLVQTDDGWKVDSARLPAAPRART